MLNPTTESGSGGGGTRRRKQSKPNRIGEEDDGGDLSDSSTGSSSSSSSSSPLLSPFKKYKTSEMSSTPPPPHHHHNHHPLLLGSTINNLINLPLLYDLLRQEQSSNPNINHLILQQQLLLFKQYQDQQRLDDVSPTLEEVNQSPKESIDDEGIIKTSSTPNPPISISPSQQSHPPPHPPSHPPPPPPPICPSPPTSISSKSPKPNSSSPPLLDTNLDPYRPLSPKLHEMKDSAMNSLDLLTKRTQEVLNSQLLEINLNSMEKKVVKEANSTFFKHRCRYCGKIFGSDSALQIHIRSHTGERPFKCNICGSRFTTKGNLKVHFQRHALKFPHIRMNPHPVPEHLDALHPPLCPDEDDIKPWKVVGVPERIERPSTANEKMEIESKSPPPLPPVPPPAQTSSPSDSSSSILRTITPVPEDLSIKYKVKEEISEDNDSWSEKSDDYDVMSSKSLPEQHSVRCIIRPRPQRPSSTSTYPQFKGTSPSTFFNRPMTPPPLLHPSIYNQLLPRPGSNDNSWESLIEISHASETSKLQQLVDNIEFKLIDPNQCIICHRVLSCKSALQMHYRTHTGERPFKCKICSRAFTTKGNLKTHMSVHRIKPSLRVYHQCPVCHKRFANGLVLQQHIRLHTGEETDLSFDEIRAGEVGGGELSPIGIPPPPPAPISQSQPSVPLSVPISFGPPTISSATAAFFPMMAMQPILALEKHVNTFDEVAPLDLTDKRHNITHNTSSNNGNGYRNGKSSSPKSNTNSGIVKSESSASVSGSSLWIAPPRFQPSGILLPPPPQIVVAPPIFQRSTTCNICLKTFACNSALEIHYRSHTKERPFKCSICERGFSTKGNMKQHMLTHKSSGMGDTTSPRSTIGDGDTDEENSKASANSEAPLSLTLHSNLHSTESEQQLDLSTTNSIYIKEEEERKDVKVSSITTSSSSSSTGGDLQAPQRPPPPPQSQSTPPDSKYLCKVCHKNFSSNSSVHIHMRTHTGDKPFKCTVCGKAFTTKGNLKVHMGTHSWTPNYNHRRGRRMSLELSSLGGFLYYDNGCSSSNPATKTNQ